MSKPGAILYVVNLHHLSSDGKKAGAELADAQLSYITAKQLRSLIEAVAALAPSVVSPVAPELRITAPEGKFVVQVRGGKLNFVSWSSKQKGGEYSAERIYSIITGEEENEGVRYQAEASEPRGGRSKVLVALLVVAIVGVNCFTAWFVTRPKKTLLPKYTVLAPEPAERLLANVAGTYETTNPSGGRRLEIDKTGKGTRCKFGPERAPVDQRSFTVKAIDAAGKPALLTSTKTMITIKDPLTVVLYGDPYQRVAR